MSFPPTTLVDLKPCFYRIEDAKTYARVDEIAQADGVMFLCPLCFHLNGGPRGTHRIICWKPGVPPDIHPSPGRWELVGTGFEDLTLVAPSSSVAILGGCRAHFYVTRGEVISCP